MEAAPSAGGAGGGGPAPAPDAPGTSAADRTARFRSMRPPSSPFWLAVLGGIVVVFTILAAAPALFVFAMGGALSFFLVPVVNGLERRGMGRGLAAILVVFGSIATAVLLLAIGALILLDQGVAFLDALPGLVAQIQADYERLVAPGPIRDLVSAVVERVHDAIAGTDWPTVAIGVIQKVLGLIGIVFGLMLLPFFTFYLVKDQPRMQRNFWEQVPEPWLKDIHRVTGTVVGDFANYFRAELVVGSILGTIVTIGMLAIGFVTGGPLGQFALLLGLIALVMELLPQIGPLISYVPALILALASGPLAVVLVSIFYFVVFNIEGSILVPTFEGKMINFSGATVLVLITIGFALAGIIGAIVALPTAAIVRDLFAYFFKEKQQESLVVEPAMAGSPARTDALATGAPGALPG